MQITCYDKTGKELKRVTSTDDGTVEDPENGTTPNNNEGDNGGSTTNPGTDDNTINEGNTPGGTGGNNGRTTGGNGGNDGDGSQDSE